MDGLGDRTILPDKAIVEVAADDPLLQEPFAFPKGAPPMWHHGGWKLLGYKHEGRWIVIYHPGDVNDAWKSVNMGANAEMVESAFRLGINIFYYAWKQRFEMQKTPKT